MDERAQAARALGSFATRHPELCPGVMAALGLRGCAAAFEHRRAVMAMRQAQEAKLPPPQRVPRERDAATLTIVARSGPFRASVERLLASGAAGVRGVRLEDDRRKAVGRELLWDRSLRYLAEQEGSALAESKPPQQLLHSFGFAEEWLTGKDAMGKMVQLVHGQVPWVSTSYRVCAPEAETGPLVNELDALVGDVVASQCAWVVKPCSGSRGRDVLVSADLAEILDACARLVASERACVVVKYVPRPLLFRGRKVDLRFLVLVNAQPPATLHVYDYFVVRVARDTYEEGAYDDVRKHLTVLGYRDPEEPDLEPTPLELAEALRPEGGDDLDLDLDLFAPHGPVWRAHEAIFALFATAFAGFETEQGVRLGPRRDHRVRALLGIDVLLCHRQGELHPVILECNYKPDLARMERERPLVVAHALAALDGAAEAMPPQGPPPGLQPSAEGRFLAYALP